MEQTQKLKLNLQHFASNNVKPQVFNPDNVMMHEKKRWHVDEWIHNAHLTRGYGKL